MSTSVCLLGVGGAGSRLVGKAGPHVAGAVHVVAVNTDARELDLAPAPVKLQIGTTRTGGLGAGGSPAAGRLAMEDDIPTLRGVLEERELVIVVAGLGGGTGSGAAPAILRAAGEAGALTLAVVTMPFAFEGAKRLGVAREALRAVHEATDTVVVIANDRLTEATGETEVKAAFERADGGLGLALGVLVNLITQPGYIRLDFADLKQLVQHSGGTCSLAFASAWGAARAKAVAQDLLGGTLLQQGKLAADAKGALIGIAGGPDLALREVGQIMEAIQGKLPADCHACMGTHVDERIEDGLHVVMLVSELWTQGGAAPAKEPEGEARPASRSGRRPGRSGAKQQQPMLGLMVTGRGRFKNVEPTLLDGEDLDIPTYIRRGIAIEN